LQEFFLSLDLSNFETDSALDMDNMFASCVKLTSLNISTFNTQNVEDFKNIFKDDKNLELYLDSNKCKNLISYLPSYVIYHDILK
jgi:surface protein